MGKRLERQGVLSFTVDQATQCLEYALGHEMIQASVLRIDWSTWRGLGITDRVSPRFEHLLVHSGSEAGEGGQATADALRNATDADRRLLVDQSLRSKAASLLGIAPEHIPADRALLELGLDSLMAVEMRNWIESHMEISMPISMLMRGDSFDEVIHGICELISGSTVSKITSDGPTDTTGIESPKLPVSDAEQLLEQLPQLDDAEVDDLLGQLLRESE